MHGFDILCQYMSRFNCKVQQSGSTTSKAQEANSFPKYEFVPKAHKNKVRAYLFPFN